jgi:hypothetical protein
MENVEVKEGVNEQLPMEYLIEPFKFKIEDLAGIHFGNLRVLTPRLPTKENRIERQKGVFVENYDPRHLKDARMTVYYFQQQPGVVFEDPLNGIDKKTLLPDDTGLTQLARTIKERFSSPDSFALDPTLSSVVMSHPTIVGSVGGRLINQVDYGGNFLEHLGMQLQLIDGQKSLSEIRKIILDYFEACWMHARIGERIPSWKNDKPFGGYYMSEAMGQATLHLARWAGLNEKIFANTIVNELNGAPSIFSDDIALKPVLEPKDLRDAISLSCGYYLAGWEHLRYVNGKQADHLTHKAKKLLERWKKK